MWDKDKKGNTVSVNAREEMGLRQSRANPFKPDNVMGGGHDPSPTPHLLLTFLEFFLPKDLPVLHPTHAHTFSEAGDSTRVSGRERPTFLSGVLLIGE